MFTFNYFLHKPGPPHYPRMCKNSEVAEIYKTITHAHYTIKNNHHPPIFNISSPIPTHKTTFQQNGLHFLEHSVNSAKRPFSTPSPLTFLFQAPMQRETLASRHRHVGEAFRDRGNRHRHVGEAFRDRGNRHRHVGKPSATAETVIGTSGSLPRPRKPPSASKNRAKGMHRD